MKPRPRRAQIHLPPLDPEVALAVVAVLESAATAIWRAHGEGMAKLAIQRDLDRRRRDSEFVDDGDPDASPDTDF